MLSRHFKDGLWVQVGFQESCTASHQAFRSLCGSVQFGGGELLHVYPSAVAAAKATYGLVYGIRGCCRGEHITSGGFRWHYVHKDTHAIIYPINK